MSRILSRKGMVKMTGDMMKRSMRK
jgi:hypothetical protein